jgi:hypothetical protein
MGAFRVHIPCADCADAAFAGAAAPFIIIAKEVPKRLIAILPSKFLSLNIIIDTARAFASGRWLLNNPGLINFHIGPVATLFL